MHVRWSVEITALVIAVVVFPFGPIAAPNYVSNGRHSAGSMRNAIINNLRQLDGAKQQLALEKKLPLDYVSVEVELMPYLRHFRHLGPERYVINSIRKDPYAVLDKDWRVRRGGWREGYGIPKGTEIRLPAP